MENEMLERVARAICAGTGQDCGQTIQGDYWTFTSEPIDYSLAMPDVIYYQPRWKAYLRSARAAIEAMREPTWEMKVAQMELLRVLVADPHERDTQAFVGLKAHRAMIDAALSPTQEKTP